MKKILILITVLVTIASFKSYSLTIDYPKYEEVVNAFFDKYMLDAEFKESQLKFEKSPLGWQIKTIIYIPEYKILKDELFWSRKKDKFTKINFNKAINDSISQSIRKHFLEKFDKRYYNLYPYFGYPDWDWDIIQDYANQKVLDDNTLYALGRAYSQHASNLINAKTGLPSNKFTFDLADGKNCMNEDQLAEYKNYADLAIETFKKLVSRNPNFITIVGSIRTKLCNEYLNHFLTLRISQNETEANYYLVDGLYSDFLIATAKNYLNSCSKNAVLFTYGDNDTYPLLYVQSKFGIRKDVLVINISLFANPRYINSFRESVGDSDPIIFSLSRTDIKEGTRDVVILYDETDSSLSLNDAIEFVADESNQIEGTNYFYLLSKKFNLQDSNGEIIEWIIDDYYILKNKLMLMDLLNNNFKKRPIYFAITMAYNSYMGLNDYFELEGLAYKLSSNKKIDSTSTLGSVNTKLMYLNFMNTFSWDGIENKEPHDNLLLMNYRFNFLRLANSFIELNKLDSSELVLDKCLSIISNEILPYDQTMINWVESYFIINNIDIASDISRKIVYNLNNKIDNTKDIIHGNSPHDVLIYYQKLKSVLLTYNQEELIKELNLE